MLDIFLQMAPMTDTTCGVGTDAAFYQLDH